jgi:hypothetical protein
MATTTFSGPIKAGTIRNTTGTTVGTDVANSGFVTMAQAAVIGITGVQGTTTVATIPANSKIISVVLNVTTANDDSTASTVLLELLPMRMLSLAQLVFKPRVLLLVTL